MLDGFDGCASVVQDTWLTAENLLLLGLVGGVLLGWGAMSGLGCTIGTLLSGTQAGAVSGWVFGATMLAAIWAGLRIKRYFVRG